MSQFKRLALFGILLIGVLLPSAYADEIKVAVASNFTAPMKQIAALFQKQTGHAVTLSFGSTGKFYAQIKNGAPYDIFVAADMKTPQRLDQDGMTVVGSRFVYALGKLVLWSAQPGVVENKGDVLRKGHFAKLAIADPKLAPYGLAAKQTLAGLGLWNTLQEKLVLGENITQAWQFVATENAKLGFVALSQIMKSGQVTRGSWWIVPSKLHQPIRQSAVLLSVAKDNASAQAFLGFLKGKQTRAIIRDFGYGLP
ncbi:MAG: molybdate ABC transporter substrate-binding protein [Gallionella sp.]